MRVAATLIVSLSILLAVGSAAGAGTRGEGAGGTFRVAEPGAYVDSVDASLVGAAGDVFLPAACSSLMRLPDEPLPGGFRTQPELAAGFPKVSSDRRTYVFTIRKGLHFSTGAPVTARDVAYTINRILSPALGSPLVDAYRPIVGAQDVLEGKAKTASGVIARGSILTIKLTHPVGDFLAGAASGLCVLPDGLPIDPEGVQPPVPTAAPYYISEYVPGQRLVLERNRFYSGSRPHHVDGFVFDLTPDDNAALDAVVSGKADYAWVPNFSFALRAPELAHTFGVNKARFFVKPSTFLRMFVLNTSRPLLRNNLPLRQAINFAIDRPALLRALGGSTYFGTLTDQFLPPIMPGFTDAHIYPLFKPNLVKARALAKGHTRSGRLNLYVAARTGPLAEAQVVKRDLRKIGLEVHISAYPPPLIFEKEANRHEPFDMGWIGWDLNEPDPGALTGLFDGSTIGTSTNQNYSYFDSPKFNGLLERASQLTGDARFRAFGSLDVALARDAAPAVAYSVDNAFALVSSRTGCVVVNPNLDLGAVCLK